MQNTRPHSAQLGFGQPIGRIIILITLLLCLVGQSSRAVAQSSGITWSVPEDLSNTPTSSTNAAIVTDGYGNVHVFWSEEVNGPIMQANEAPRSGNTIFHKSWDGTAWTDANDILFVPDDSIAEFIAVAVGPDNMLYAVWTGQSNIYYSYAPALQAGSAHAWSRPKAVATDSARSAFESSIVVDAAGNVHITYAAGGTDPGIYHIQSADGGATWSTEIKLSNPFDPFETSFSRVKMITDDVGRLHVVWETTQSLGFGQAIYYSRSTDGGLTWSKALQLGYRQSGDFDVGWPYMTALGESTLRVIYNAGSSTGATGRYERISTDGGETWSEPQHIITDMSGINGYNVPIVDGLGRLHLIINMRTRDTQAVGIYYSDWFDNKWGPVVPVFNDPTNIGAATAHYVAVTLRHGNEIHVVWTQNEGGEIWYMRGTIQGILPTIKPTPPAPTIEILATPKPAAAITQSQRVPIMVQGQFGTSVPRVNNSAGSSPFIWGVIAVFVLLAFVFLWRRIRPH